MASGNAPQPQQPAWASSNPLGPSPTLSQGAAAAAVLAAVSFLFTCQSADFTNEAPTLPPQWATHDRVCCSSLQGARVLGAGGHSSC